jgi:TfoX/Sxy family transcriptional regulator of competence genes
MATQQRTVDFLLEQLAGVDDLSARKMFGEWGLFLDGKTVALVCNDQLYLKPTEAGRAHAPDASEEPAYRGAKPSLLIEADAWDDAEWLARLIRATADALPAPKPKKPKKKAA